ncbi:hypothetical protein Vretimale_4880 [Volvox reticuliferus]|uniref:Uncharacterized protein n=1 Tax=Volvox reticuliferus TaxID=1737510 RepID=A0A8J4DBR2_9CHLO|nr:hypothetical protein Vretifemale_3505 [Volvox reticuliferus]GIL99746.1 hypothetical protein Vretimale_4880 [Volvox reticuliferus]
MFALIGSQLRRGRSDQLHRGLGGALSSGSCSQQRMAMSTSTSISAASADGASEERREGAQYMTSEHSTASAWDTPQPKLGTWPNIEPGVGRPDVVQPPEPSVFVKERKMPIIGGVSDADLISENDRIRGTADVNDNSA